jgi:hypothetical protein
LEVIHRLSLNVGAADQAELAEFGVELPLGFGAVDIVESDQRWPAWQAWIDRRRPSDVVRTHFSDREVRQAHHLSIRAESQVGYPQPHEDDFGYLEATYDLSDFCDVCGIGLRQKAPFQMKGEPRWGRRDIIQLNWVFDEFFVRVGAPQRVFEAQGVEGRPVIDRSETELSTVVQLHVGETVRLDTRELAGQKCSKCGRVKYHPIVRGLIPKILDQAKANMVKTYEWFGSGRSAWRETLISQDLHAAIDRSHLRGLTFIPVANTEPEIGSA